MQASIALDGSGGGTVAADEKGNVYVASHGSKIGGPRGDDQRLVWIAVSKDEGKTFAKEVPVWGKVTGVCGFVKCALL
jgi:hypothetical protein